MEVSDFHARQSILAPSQLHQLMTQSNIRYNSSGNQVRHMRYKIVTSEWRTEQRTTVCAGVTPVQ